MLPDPNHQMVWALSQVMARGTAVQSNTGTTPWVPMFGKTGTTDGAKDTWMSGASSKVATVVGVVTVTGNANQRAINFESGPAATARHRMWPAVMSVANAKYGGDPFPGVSITPPGVAEEDEADVDVNEEEDVGDDTEQDVPEPDVPEGND